MLLRIKKVLILLIQNIHQEYIKLMPELQRTNLESMCTQTGLCILNVLCLWIIKILLEKYIKKILAAILFSSAYVVSVCIKNLDQESEDVGCLAGNFGQRDHVFISMDYSI
jgi:hypothetical protein